MSERDEGCFAILSDNSFYFVCLYVYIGDLKVATDIELALAIVSSLRFQVSPDDSPFRYRKPLLFL